MVRCKSLVLSSVKLIFINYYTGQSGVVRCKKVILNLKLHRTTPDNTVPSGVSAESYVTLTSSSPKLDFELCNLITYFRAKCNSSYWLEFKICEHNSSKLQGIVYILLFGCLNLNCVYTIYTMSTEYHTCTVLCYY